MATTTANPRAPQAAAVLELLLDCERWELFRGPSGRGLWRIPGGGGTYTVSRTSCTCPSDEYNPGTPCKHRVALHAYLVIARDTRRRRADLAPPKETTDSVA